MRRGKRLGRPKEGGWNVCDLVRPFLSVDRCIRRRLSKVLLDAWMGDEMDAAGDLQPSRFDINDSFSI